MLRKAQFRFAQFLLMSALALCQKLVDINTASEREVAALPQIGRALAKKIIRNRPYASVDDLVRAEIPARTRELLKSRVTVSRTLKETPGPQGGLITDRMTPAERAKLNEKLARLNDVLFDYGKATVSQEASTVLKSDVESIREILANYPNQKLLVEGSADERGSEEYNVALGDRRARAAEEFLVSMGIQTSQLMVVSYGKERPICTDKTENCWQRNQRAHITVAK